MKDQFYMVIGACLCGVLACTTVEEVGEGQTQIVQVSDEAGTNLTGSQGSSSPEVGLSFENTTWTPSSEATSDPEEDGTTDIGDSQESNDDASPDEGGELCESDADCTALPPESCDEAVCESGLCVTVARTDGTPCDDGNICTDEDQCTSGICSGFSICECLTDADCVSSGTCVESVCSPEGVCGETPLTGTPCDDGNVCTENDLCAEGVCAGEAIELCSCDDSGISLSNGESACTLGEALERIDPGGTVSLAPGVFVIEGVEVEQSVVIEGAGLGDTTLEVYGTGFSVKNSNLTISSVQIEGGITAISVTGVEAHLVLDEVRLQAYNEAAVDVQEGRVTLNETMLLGAGPGQSDGLKIESGGQGTITGGLILNHSGSGITLDSGSLTGLSGLTLKNNQSGGITAVNSSLQLSDAIIEANGQYGILLNKSSAEVTLSKIHNTQGSPGHGVWSDSSTAEFKGSRMYNNVGHGVSAINGETVLGFTEEGDVSCEVNSNQSSGVMVEGNGILTVDGVEFQSNHGANVRMTGGSLQMSGAHVYLSKNGDEGHGIHLSLCDSPALIEYSLVELNEGHGVLLEGCDATMVDNTGIRYNSLSGVKAVSGSKLTLENCLSVEQNGSAGIWFLESSGSVKNVSVLGGVEERSGIDDGILVEQSEDVKLENNQITGMGGWGIRGLETKELVQDSNNIQGNQLGGIFLEDCTDLDVRENVLVANLNVGIMVERGNGNLTGNTVQGSIQNTQAGIGILLTGSSDATIPSDYVINNNITKNCEGSGVVTQYAELGFSWNKSMENGSTGFLFATGTLLSVFSSNEATLNGTTGFICGTDLPIIKCDEKSSFSGNADGGMSDCKESCFVSVE